MFLKAPSAAASATGFVDGFQIKNDKTITKVFTYSPFKDIIIKTIIIIFILMKNLFVKEVNMKKVTVVGCGVMGSALINALMKAGFEVTIVDLNEEAAEKFVKQGAHYASDLSEATDVDCIVLNLPTHEIARAVVAGADADKLKGKTLVNTTTSSPSEVLDMDQLCAGLGIVYLDAKIEVYPGDIGTPAGYLVYSGSEMAFNETKPALEAFGKAVYLGEDVVGASVTDLAVLQVHFTAIAGLAEAAAFCIKNNYSVQKFVDQTREILPIMLEGNLRSFGEELADYQGTFEDASECTLNIEATAEETIIKALNEAGVKTPCGDSVLKLFKDGIQKGNAGKNVCSIVNELI